MLTIRRATRDDLDAVWALIHLLAEHQGHLDELDATPDDIAAALFGPEPHAFCELAILDGRVVGNAIWFYSFSTWTGRQGIYLEDLVVVDAARGAGVGLALLANLSARVEAEGLARIEWIVMNDNLRGAAFYQRHGVKPLDDQTTYRLEGEALRALAAKAASSRP
jgi:ribosomal protein S18 acetylase RimI-like enzyme